VDSVSEEYAFTVAPETIETTSFLAPFREPPFNASLRRWR